MRNPASEKLEIIRLVEQSHLPVPAPPFTTGMIFIDPAGLRPWKIVAHSGNDPGAGPNSGCGRGFLGKSGHSARAAEPSAKLDALIAVCAAENGLPEILLHRVIKRESNYNAGIHHRGHWV